MSRRAKAKDSQVTLSIGDKTWTVTDCEVTQTTGPTTLTVPYYDEATRDLVDEFDRNRTSDDPDDFDAAVEQWEEWGRRFPEPDGYREQHFPGLSPVEWTASVILTSPLDPPLARGDWKRTVTLESERRHVTGYIRRIDETAEWVRMSLQLSGGWR